jgi:hypothetical protein
MYRIYFNRVFFVATEGDLDRVLDKVRGMGYRYRVTRM